MLTALQYLHNDQKITHRDIKPANILMLSRTPNIFIKLCDFGLATNNKHLKTRCGTAVYSAAEIYSRNYDNSVDIWATAVVALELLRGLPAYPINIKPNRWCLKVRKSIETICGQAYDSLMLLLKRMLELRPENRPSAQACLADQSMSISQFSPSPLGSGYDVVATEVSSEQPPKILTRILEPLADCPGWDRPTTPQGSSKRLRSSICRSQVVDDSRKQPSTNHHHLRSSRASSRKIHVVAGRTGRKTIAKPQASPIDNFGEVYPPSCPDGHERRVAFSQILREWDILSWP